MAFDTVEELRLQLGERNSRYSSLEFVGAGAMGSVFKGFDERLRRTIALKVIHRALINTDLVYERFKREARLLSSISHKNVVHLFDFEDAGTLCFITEEYIDGFPLNVLLAEGKLKLAEIVSLVAALADGLQAVHDAGILHRDIKPNNIIVDERGEPHLLDFGLAQSFEGKGATALTKTGHVVGTLGFISPEVLLGETATKRSDVYQLGAVFYSALSGKAVYGRKAIAGLLKEGALDNPASLSQLGCVCDRQIEELVMSCVASEPEKRPLSAGEVRDSCTAWLKSLEETELLESQTLLIEPAGEADVSPSREFKKLPFLAFVISFLICIFYWYGSNEVFVIRDVEIKSGVTKVEVNWKTDKETAFVYEIHESKTRQLVAKGVESAATKEHNIKCSKLAPSTSYSMTLRWQGAYHQRAFRTEKVRFTKPIYTAFLGGVFFAEFSTNLDRSTKLELMSVTREQLAECRGEERVVIAGLGRLSDNSVNWQLKAGNRIIASGRTKAIQPQKPREWAAEQEPSCKPIWDGDLLYVADKRGFLTCYELARKPSSPKKNDTYGGLVRKWCFAPHSGPLARCATLYQLADGRLVLMLRNTNYGKWEIWCIDPVLRNKEWLERVGSLSSLPPWLHGNRDRWNKHLGPSEWCRVVEMPEGVSFAEELAVSDDLAVIQGIKKGPCWFAFSLSNGEKKWFLEAMEILPKKLKPVKAERQMLELDMGFSPVLKHGWGFLTAPTIHEKSVHSVLAFGMSVKKPVKCALVEFSLQRRKVSSIPFKGYSGRTFLSRDSLGVSYSAGNEIRRYDSNAREQRVLTSYPKGAFGPPVSSKDKNYCIHLATDSNSTSSIKELIGFQKASLALYKQRNDLVVYKPPVFHEPIGAYQATGVYAFERWKDYLVGHTFFTVFVINIRTGHFGSWRSFEGGVVKSAVSKSGMIAVITRSGKLMVLPVMLIEKLRTGRFTDN